MKLGMGAPPGGQFGQLGPIASPGGQYGQIAREASVTDLAERSEAPNPGDQKLAAPSYIIPCCKLLTEIV